MTCMGMDQDIAADAYVSPADLTVDNCDKEPIHIPGTIQPFGTLIAGPDFLERIDYAAENLARFIGLEPSEVLGKSVRDILDRDTIHDLRNVLAMSTARTQRERVGAYTVNGHEVELYASVNMDGVTILEIEPVETASGKDNPIDTMRFFLARGAAQPNIESMLRVCVTGLHRITGYDRVMAYRYEPDGSGEVVAESRNPGIDSFLGLRYPAWDVPAQARAMQVKNPVRTISDIAQDPISVLARDESLPDLNMSLAHLRGISPIHTQYLRNMGVGATLTIGLIVHGKLWGMFSCHHNEKKIIRSDVRIAVELFGQMVSLLVQQRQERDSADMRSRSAEARRTIQSETDAETDIIAAFPRLSSILRNLVSSDGVAVIIGDIVTVDGETPGKAAIRKIGSLRPDDEMLTLATDSLAEAGWTGSLDTGPSAGALLVRAAGTSPVQLVFFRNEKTKNLKWAGRPEKELSDGPYGKRITPRGSFDAYMEEQKGKSVPWLDIDLQAAGDLQSLLMQIMAKNDRRQMLRHKDMVTHQRKQDLMIAELNHRVKNILALIRSLSRQARDSSDSLESYALALEQRISALATAHDLAVANSLSGVSLKAIIDTEVQPYKSKGSRVLLNGPPVGLRADVAPMIALVFHEIVTNAAKYGALSTPSGQVDVRWSQDDAGLSFSWVESGGPRVKAPERKGFGQSLITKAIPYEFDGTVKHDYLPEGVEFHFTLPTSTLVDVQEDAEPEIIGSLGTIEAVVAGKTGLLLEDNLVLAMDMVESLSRLGATDVESVGTMQSAMNLVEERDFDFATLDMNIRGSVSFDLAIRLKSKGVPFLFVTGYGSKVELPAALVGTTILTKPVDDASLSNALEQLLKQ